MSEREGLSKYAFSPAAGLSTIRIRKMAAILDRDRLANWNVASNFANMAGVLLVGA